MQPKVAIVSTSESPTLFDAIKECLTLLGTEKILHAKKILLKPNCLNDRGNAATDPEVLRSTIQVIQALKEGQAYQLLIGDSPGLMAKKSRAIFKNLGFMDIIEETGIEYTEFDGGRPPQTIQIPDGVRLTETKIAPSFAEADLIVNLPRLKTHILTMYTGAVKNYWGIQPGGMKPRNHLKGKTTEKFSQVIADLYRYVRTRPQITIMGGAGMEGGGPSSGSMRPLNFIIGGFDPVAVDAVAITIVGHDPFQDVPHIRICADQNLGTADLGEIEVVGKSIDDVKLEKPFRFPGRGIAWAGGVFASVVYRYTKKIPSLRKKLCIKCGNCAQICPGEAITLTPYPKFNRKKCINCLCCVETCPEDALKVTNAGLFGVLGLQ
jgi:uncharacterized protein (DUF362 family)/Pyruvate/2-oxoacid:ferredoxin oxidoreductase delta subunit